MDLRSDLAAAVVIALLRFTLSVVAGAPGAMSNGRTISTSPTASCSKPDSCAVRRMQLVEVESGPLERAFGLATVSLKTASPETGARIPGLSPE